MPGAPTLVFVPGAWHQASCFDAVIRLLHDEHNLDCVAITLPSTQDNPNATFKNDVDAARDAILSATTQGNDVIVIAHSYGGMIGNSAIKGLTLPRGSSSGTKQAGSGYVLGLVLIASGFTITGLAFMDPLFGKPPAFWRVNNETGYAELVGDSRHLFYHDVPRDEGEYWVSQLKTHSLKTLFEGGEHAYAGWQDVPTWYIGTLEDQGLPVALQRVIVGMARGQGGVVHHTELQSGHSPFLSMPKETASIILQSVEKFTGPETGKQTSQASLALKGPGVVIPVVRLTSPVSWLRFGVPLLFGRFIGWGIVGFTSLRRIFGRRSAS